MAKRGEKPRRLMTKVRRQVGRPTMRHNPKTVYNRSEAKRELQELIEEECTCIGMECTCGLREVEDA